jgi:hypothetical protein
VRKEEPLENRVEDIDMTNINTTSSEPSSQKINKKKKSPVSHTPLSYSDNQYPKVSSSKTLRAVEEKNKDSTNDSKKITKKKSRKKKITKISTDEISPAKMDDKPASNLVHPYESLPEKVRTSIEEMGVDKQLLEKFSDHLYNCARFVMKDCFPEEGGTRPETKRKYPFAPVEMLDHAQSLIQTPKKPFKKLYKVHAEAVGKGGFGSVMIVKSKVNGVHLRYAAKKLPYDNDRTIESVHSEIAYLNFCRGHPNIVQYHESYLLTTESKKPEVWIIMEYLQGGTLKEASKSKLFTDIHIAYIAREILTGLNFLHNKNIAHRDLKSANIMMSVKGEIKLNS